MKKGFSVQSILTGIRATADHGLSVNFHTNELTTEEKAKIMGFHNGAGWLLFAEDTVQDIDIPKNDTTTGLKTPSQRLRGCLYVLWQQRGAQGDFEAFYKMQMDKFINLVKEKLL